MEGSGDAGVVLISLGTIAKFGEDMSQHLLAPSRNFKRHLAAALCTHQNNLEPLRELRVVQTGVCAV